MSPAPVAAVVLAAGSSRRAGSLNKLLAPVGGVPMLARAVGAAQASAARPVIVVTGHQAAAVADALATAADSVRIVHNPDFDDGMGSSIARGVSVVPADAGGVLVVLGDMPALRPADIDRLIGAATGPRSICVPVAGGRRGNPVLFGSAYLPELAALSGDRGARSVIAAHDDQVIEVTGVSEGVLTDLDTADAIAAFNDAADADKKGLAG